jgi:hypothetical protein
MNDLTEPGELPELTHMRGEVTGRRPAELRKAHAMLLAEINDTRQTRDSGPIRRRAHHGRSRWLRPALLFGGVAAGLAAVLVVSLLPGGTARQPQAGQHPSGRTALTAAYILNRAASAAAATPQPVPRPDQFIYYSSVGMSIGYMNPGSPHEQAWLFSSRTQGWTSVDGLRTGMAHVTDEANEKLPWGPVPPPVTRDPYSWSTVPRLNCPGRAPARGTYAFLATLPTDPALLRTWIYGHLDGQNPPDKQAWNDIRDMLLTLAPPRVAAALYRVLATIPGVTVVPDAANAVGRIGIAVSRAGAELIFDPRTYQFIGERAVLTKPEAGVGPAGTVIQSSAMLQWKVVDSLPDVPPSQLGSGGSPNC